MRFLSAAVAMAGLLLVGRLQADQWDLGPSDDSRTTTRNELVHGSEQLHDLATTTVNDVIVADRDWYVLAQQPLASYEIVVDSTSARIGGITDIDRMNSSGAVLQSAQVIGAGFSRSLRWQNTGTAQEFARIQPGIGACNPSCGPEDVYRVRFYETSYGISRFNNAGTQTTVLLIQNPTAYTIAGVLYFWNGTGTQLATQSFSLSPKQILNLSLGGVTGLAGQSGSITLTHDGRYGDLVGKAVSLEPSTGFSFDTLMVARPR
jgi:hypothetical protein